MKTSDEILDRVRGLLAQELERRLAETQQRLPHLCTYNHRQPANSKQVEGEENPLYNRIATTSGTTIGLCMYGAEHPEDWPGDICEDPIDAQRCPLFKPLLDRDSVVRQFKEQLQTPEWVEENMPRLSELLWVLESTQVPTIPFWKRWFLRLRRLSLEPVRPTVDPAWLLDQ